MPEAENTPRRDRRSKNRRADDLVTENLVRQIADRVYTMLMQDLTIERERLRPSSKGLRSHGGWSL